MVSATRSMVAGSSMSRRVAVSGSSRWWRTSVPTTATSASPNPMRVAMVGGDRLAHLAVVAGPALADVVQQRGHQQQVGAVDVAGQLRGGGRGLDEVPVDGEAVPGVALREGADPVPLRDQAGQQPLLVQLLEDGDGGPPAGQQPEERPAHLRGPRLGHRLAVHREHLERVGRQQQVRPGGGRRGAQQQAGVGGRAGVAGEHDLVALPHHALGHRLAAHAAVAAAGPAHERRLHPPPGLVRDEGQPAPGQAHLAQQRVLVGQAEGDGDRPLLLAHQDVVRAAGCGDGARPGRRAGGRRRPPPRRWARRRAAPRPPRAAPGPRATPRRPP